MLRKTGVIAAAMWIAGCGGSDGSVEPEADSGDDVAAETAVDDSAALDSESADTESDSAADSSGGDSSSVDSSSSEVEADSAASDTGAVDSTVIDSAVADSAVADSAVTDSAIADSAVVDSAIVDSAVVDSAVADGAADTSVDTGADTAIDVGVDASCATGTHACSGHCAMDDSVTECGAACVTCTAPAHATSICSSGACDFACTSPYVKSGAACVPPTTRPISPLSTETVTTHKPKLSWKLPAGFTQVHVDVCADRACGTIRWSKDVTGSSVVLDTALPAGVSFWRVYTLEGTTKSASSPVWELVTMGAGHDGAVSSSWTSFNDFDGDGYADIVADTNDSSGSVHVHRGSATGIQSTSSQEWHGPLGIGQSSSLGDIDGDGFGDIGFLIPDGADGRPDVEYVLGGPSGPSATATRLAHMPGNEYTPVAAGDVNGDGYGDVLTRGINGTAHVVYVRFGSAGGIPAAASITIPEPPALGAGTGHSFGARAVHGVGLSTIGDFDGDGYADIAIGSFENDETAVGSSVFYGSVYIYRGSATGPATTPSQTILNPNKTPITGTTSFGSSLYPAGDVNGDGYPDLLVASIGGATGTGVTSGQYSFVFYGGSGGTLGTPTTLPCLAPTGGIASYVIAGGGDLNADGFADVTCNYLTDKGSGSVVVNEYGSHLFLGGATGASTVGKSLVAYNPNTKPGNVYSAVLPGDVDGDGIADYVTLTEWRDAGDLTHRSVETWKGTSPTLTTASTRIFAYDLGEILASIYTPSKGFAFPVFHF